MELEDRVKDLERRMNTVEQAQEDLTRLSKLRSSEGLPLDAAMSSKPRDKKT